MIDVLHRDQALVDYLADRLVALGDSVPEEIPGFRLISEGAALRRPRYSRRGRNGCYDFRNLPGGPVSSSRGRRSANRAAFAKWGAWINAFGAKEYGRPLFMAASADLADSTNISGFAEGYGDFKGYGWYERYGTADGVLLPQEITEFANVGHPGRDGDRELRPRPGAAFRRVLGRVLHLRLVLLSQVRAHAPLQPARAGLRAEDSAR